MDKLLYSLTCLIVSTFVTLGLGYIIGSFVSSSFDLNEWNISLRIFIAFFAFVFSLSFTKIAIDDFDK